MPTVINNIIVSPVGAAVLNTASPSAVSWIRVNADNTITYRTAAQTVSDLAITTTNVSEGTNLYFTDARVRATTLTGLSISGSTIASTDTVLQAFGKLQNQVTAVVGGVNYQGTWNATTNSPALVSSTGTKGYYYVVSVAGSTNLDGITDWKLGDWVIFNGATWEKVDNTDAVISVNGYTGAVTLAKADVGLGNVENTALSTWAGSANLVTLGSAITGTGAITLGTSSSVAGSVVLKNATNAFTQTIRGTNPAASIIYDLPTTAPTLGQVLSATAPAAGVVTLSWATAASGITIGGTAISGGTDNRILFQDATASDFVTQLANFTMSAVATGYLDVPVGYALAGHKLIKEANTTTLSMGNLAGNALTTSVNDAFFGYNAGAGVTDGGGFGRNSFFGSGSGQSCVSVYANTAVGYNALNACNSLHNTVIGHRAFDAAGASTQYVVALGSQAGVGLTGNNSYSIYIGGNAQGGGSNVQSSIVIGYNGQATAAHQGILGSNDASGYVDNIYFNGVSHSAPYSIVLHASHGSGTNVAAANFTLSGGAATGTAAGGYVKTTTSVKRASGTTQQSDTDRNVIVGKYVDITESAATTFGSLALATSGTEAGGAVFYTIRANDGTDYQCLTGVLKYDVVNKAGTLTVVYEDDQNGTGACSAGTLTATVTVATSGTTAQFQCNAVSSLAQTTLSVSFQVLNNYGVATISPA